MSGIFLWGFRIWCLHCVSGLVLFLYLFCYFIILSLCTIPHLNCPLSFGSTDCEPEGVSDWSFHENCLFCCLRREKVKVVSLFPPVLLSGICVPTISPFTIQHCMLQAPQKKHTKARSLIFPLAKTVWMNGARVKLNHSQIPLQQSAFENCLFLVKTTKRTFGFKEHSNGCQPESSSAAHSLATALIHWDGSFCRPKLFRLWRKIRRRNFPVLFSSAHWLTAPR